MGKFGADEQQQEAGIVAPNSLRSKTVVRLVDLISEGPIKGLVNGLQSVFFDKVPVQNSDGSPNVFGVSVDPRNGYPVQDVLEGMADVEAAYQVGQIVKAASPVVQNVQSSVVNAVRVKVSTGSFYTSDSKGNMLETAVAFGLQFRSSGGVWKTGYFDTSFLPFGGVSPVTDALKYSFNLQVPANTNYDLIFYYRQYGTSTWIIGDRFRGYNSDVGRTIYGSCNILDLNAAQYEVTFGETYGNVFGNVQNDLRYHDYNASITIRGKTTSGYEESYRMELPAGGAPWQIRIIRYTPDATDYSGDASSQTYTQDQITFSAYTEIVDSKLMYSDSAVIGITSDTQYNSAGLPARAYDMYLRIIRVPTNYDPYSRAYNGIWDGTFKLEWTNNPVWCFLDILTHDRYGLGQWIKDDYLDFSALYMLARYCDELVPDGRGGYEPRFVFNTIINSQAQAFSVLNMFASVFRGMIYWASGQVTATQDAPGPVSRVVNRSNVLAAGFSYTGVPLNARHSVALVSWNDPDNFYSTTVDVVEDNDLKARFGYITTAVTAFGCTSRGQALRMGRWLLDTEKYANNVVTYRAGWDHKDARPGEIIAVSDPEYAGTRQGGRVVEATLTSVTMDAPYTFSRNETYSMSVVIPTWGRVRITNGSAVLQGDRTKFKNALREVLVGDVILLENDNRQYVVQSVTSDGVLTFTAPYTGVTRSNLNFTVFRNNTILYTSLVTVIDVPLQIGLEGAYEIVPLAGTLPGIPNNGVPFVITGSDIAPRLFRIVNNKEVGPSTFEISAMEHDPTKYLRVETGYQAKTTKKLIDDRTPLTGPENISCRESIYRSNNQVRTRLTISWIPTSDARVAYYQLIYSYNGGPFQLLSGTSDTTFDMVDETPGNYVFGVRAVGNIAAGSAFIYKTFTALGKTAPPADVTNFTALRTVNGTQLNWTPVEDIDVVGYEIREGLSWDEGVVITTQMNGTTEYIQLSDTLQHTFFIKALDDTGNYSTNASAVVTSVIPPATVLGFYAVQDNDRIIFKWSKVEGTDIRYEIREGDSFAIGRSVAIVSGNDANVMYPLDGNRKFWIKSLSSLGLYSTIASFTSVTLVSIQSRNIVYESDRSAEMWPGANFGVETTGFGNHSLELQDGLLTGYQTFQIILGYEVAVKARCWYDYTFVSDAETPAWQDANFTWDDPLAQVPWQPLLDVGGARTDWFISAGQTAFGPTVNEIWSFETSLTGFVAATEATQGIWVPKQGVLSIGTYITSVEPKYTIDVATTFTLQISVLLDAQQVYTEQPRYTRTGGSGNRAGICTVTSTFTTTSGAFSALVDGSTADSLKITAGQTFGNIVFDFGSGAQNYIDQIRWIQSAIGIQGVFDFEGSNDNSAWTLIDDDLTLGDSATTTITLEPKTQVRFRYFRLRQIGGATVNTVFIREVEFRISNALGTYSTLGLQLAQVKNEVNGTFIRLLYLRDTSTPRLLVTDGNPAHDLTMDVPNVNGVRLSLAVVQSETTRSLYMYDWDSTLASRVFAAIPSEGTYTTVAA